ncbi:MAG: hypothetical protein AAGA01_15365, partial [Cyanobacteria bacterium P01_E01_bin.43]
NKFGDGERATKDCIFEIFVCPLISFIDPILGSRSPFYIRRHGDQATLYRMQRKVNNFRNLILSQWMRIANLKLRANVRSD